MNGKNNNKEDKVQKEAVGESNCIATNTIWLLHARRHACEEVDRRHEHLDGLALGRLDGGKVAEYLVRRRVLADAIFVLDDLRREETGGKTVF